VTRSQLDRAARLGCALLIASLLAACSSAPRRGGYYQDDGPGASPPANLDKIADAEPRIEPLNRAANNPYSVFGRQYVPFRSPQPYRQRGIASWYGRKFHGQRTSSGERYDMYAMTAAHPILPIPSYARVTNTRNGRSVIVRVNDRGPFLSGRIMDLSYAAAYKLGYIGAGSAPVEVEAILPEDIRTARWREAAPVETAPEPARALPAIEATPAPSAAAAVAESSAAALATAPAGEIAPPAPVVGTSAATPTAQPEPKNEVSIPITTESSGIYVQLGAFSARENAESLRVKIYQQLAWLNQPIRILPENGLFRVHLGPYRDRSEAMEIADKIRDSLELKPVVVVR
jgi:rare lipoprotein A